MLQDSILDCDAGGYEVDSPLSLINVDKVYAESSSFQVFKLLLYSLQHTVAAIWAIVKRCSSIAQTDNDEDTENSGKKNGLTPSSFS